MEQDARRRPLARGERQGEADHQAGGAGGHAGAQADADGALEPHRPPRANIMAARMRSTTAIIPFSHFADAAAPNRMPPHEPICTPRTAVAASAGASWPCP